MFSVDFFCCHYPSDTELIVVPIMSWQPQNHLDRPNSWVAWSSKMEDAETYLGQTSRSLWTNDGAVPWPVSSGASIPLKRTTAMAMWAGRGRAHVWYGDRMMKRSDHQGTDFARGCMVEEESLPLSLQILPNAACRVERVCRCGAFCRAPFLFPHGLFGASCETYS
jgi:hypothetical protein